jgi:hypothetical protein
MRGCPGPHTNRTYDVSTSLWREVVYERLRLETGLSHRYTDDCAACTGNGQRTRAIQNEATKKAIRRTISIGWGGRDRTSEWRNQNPLPYRLATPQQAEPERADDAPCPNRFGQRPVYRGCQAISTGWKAQFRPKSAPRQRDSL